MMRTVVVAGEAGQTRSIVLPRGFLSQSTDDIPRRANIGADAAFHAPHAVNVEGLVCNEIACEETAKETGVDAWPTADDQVGSRLAMNDRINKLMKFFISLRFLFLFFLWRVYVKERQSDIRFG